MPKRGTTTDLRDRREDSLTFVKLLRQKQYVSAATAIFRNLPQPPEDGAYEKTAACFLKGGIWSPATVDLAMKPVFDVPLGDRASLVKALEPYVVHSGYNDKKWETLKAVYGKLEAVSADGREFLQQGVLPGEALAASGKFQSLEDCLECIAQISTRFRDYPGEFICFKDLLHGEISLEKALKASRRLELPIRNERYEEKMQAFSHIYRKMYKGKNNNVERALKACDVALRHRAPEESPQSAAERLISLNKALEGQSRKNKSWKKTALDARNLFLWIEKAKEKGTFGARTTAAATCLVVEKLLLASSPEEAISSVLSALGQGEIDEKIVQEGTMISIGGIRLDIRETLE